MGVGGISYDVCCSGFFDFLFIDHKAFEPTVEIDLSKYSYSENEYTRTSKNKINE